MSHHLSNTIQQIRCASYAPPHGGVCDFSVIRGDDEWHFFHILWEFGKRNDCHGPGQGDTLGHATSPDLITWTPRPPALTVRPGQWDSRHLWAPHVVKHENLWYMAYTGLDDGAHQRIGFVTSPDLYHWDPAPGQPGIDAAQYPWSMPPQHVDSPLGIFPNYLNCRDPYLFRHENQWLCYYTATRPDGDSQAPVTALASSDDLLTWRDEGYIISSSPRNGENTGTWQMESPCVFERNGLYYLVYNQGAGMRYVVSDTPRDFAQSPIKHLMDGIFNFDILDVESGLFAFAAQGFFASLRFGVVHFQDNGDMVMDLSCPVTP